MSAEVYYLSPKIYHRDTRRQKPLERHPPPRPDSATAPERSTPSPPYVEKRKAASRQPESNLCQKHVTFELDPPRHEVLEEHPAFRQRRYSGRAGDVTAIDHRVAINGGTTSTLECLPRRLNIFKHHRKPGPQARIEELTREIGHLNQELAYYKDTRKVLIKLLSSVQAASRNIQEIWRDADKELSISEQRYLDYWVPQYEQKEKANGHF